MKKAGQTNQFPGRANPGSGQRTPPSRLARRAALIFFPTAAAVAGLVACCLYFGFIQFNYPSRALYPVRGVDVSHHQGEIDWPALARQNIRFVYIKATEGGDFKDKRFLRNWYEARKAGLATGAYHFFRADKTGAQQAANFILTVPPEPDALPPVLDMECPVVPPGPERDAVRTRIGECLRLMAAHYGKTPVIYTTYEAYDAYIRDGFQDYPLWIRSVFFHPDETALQRGWLLWQYSSRGRLDGYSGPERHIDLNVFNGTEDAFARFWQGKI